MSHQQVPEEPLLAEFAQPDHVVHAVHRGGVHRPHGALHLLGELVHLRYRGVGVKRCGSAHAQAEVGGGCRGGRPRTFPSSSSSWSCPVSVAVTSAPISTPMLESSHTKSPWVKTSGVRMRPQQKNQKKPKTDLYKKMSWTLTCM